MPVITARRLRVRDDGTGQSRSDDASLDDFQGEDAIVVLGNPGMGKTTLFKSIPDARFSTIRRFLAASPPPGEAPLFLDGLDEYRILAKGQDSTLRLAEALQSVGRPRFRISCRAADWYGSSDLEVLREASASGRIVILELLPLTEKEIATAIKGEVADPIAFLAEAKAAGVADLLGNPQMLDLVVKAWRTTNKPRNKYEAYDIGVDQLIREMNETHAANTPRDISPSALRAAAASAASTVMLSNISGVSRSEAVETDEYVHVSVVPHSNIVEVEQSLERRVFHSPDVHRFELIHRTIMEFLAAEDLVARIRGGLPVDRVFALMCGADGKPVSSLRGLFAWLIAKDSTLANSYADLDAYAVATYGDCEVLSPEAQRRLLVGLSRLPDPWFLANENDQSSFRGLANQETKAVLLDILQDANASTHSKITMLKAIANSASRFSDLETILGTLVLNKGESTWLRTEAIKAYRQSVGGDIGKLEALDHTLATSVDDDDAVDVRVSLLKELPDIPTRASRIISIIEQVAERGKEAGGRARRVVGRLYSLSSIAQEADLDEVIDGMLPSLSDSGPDRIELGTIFDILLARRLKAAALIDPERLARWMQALGSHRHSSSDRTFEELTNRFKKDPQLFNAVFEILFDLSLVSSSALLSINFWRAIPPNVWPFDPAEYLIERANSEINSSRAAELVQAYISVFKNEGASVSTAEKGFDFLSTRSDVNQILGTWSNSPVPAWLTRVADQRTTELTNQANDRDNNVRVLTDVLPSIQDGSNVNVLAWAAGIYLCLNFDLDASVDGRQRLIDLTNEQLADSILEGFCKFVEHESIPSDEQILNAGATNITPLTHTLVALSLYHRLKRGLPIPKHAILACIAAAITVTSFREGCPDLDDLLLNWLKAQFVESPTALADALRRAWELGATSIWIRTRRFFELKDEQSLHPLLAKICGDVLEGLGGSNLETVQELLPFLLGTDARRALQIAERETSYPDLPIKLKAIWETALFILSPSTSAGRWQAFVLGGPVFEWEVLDLLNGNDLMKRPAPSLTLSQRARTLEVIGTRFSNTSPPTGTFCGHENAWDAADYVGGQIKILATSESDDGGQLLEELLTQPKLDSYHDLIRHHLAQRAKKERELTFAYSSPAEIAKALRNQAPASPRDLLAYIIDHLNALRRELKSTQAELFRAYWNQSGKTLVSPKYEEDCSALLAADLQTRIRPHNLIVTVEHHMVDNKECDIVVLQGPDRMLPIEAKHHFHGELWTAWREQLDKLYTRDAAAGGLGIYLVFWSGEHSSRKLPKLPAGMTIKPTDAQELQAALEAQIPEKDRSRLRVVVVDISPVT